MQDGIAIASIVATATVAIAVPIISARAERVRLRGQLQNDRLDELRGVLDLAALVLSQADRAINMAELAVERSQARAATDMDQRTSQTALAEIDRALDEVAKQRVRLSLRTGSDAPLAVEYGVAHDALIEEHNVLRDTFYGGPVSDDPVGWKEVVVPLHRARRNFEEAQRAVLNLAAELISPL